MNTTETADDCTKTCANIMEKMIKAIIMNQAKVYSLLDITPSVCNRHTANN